MSEVPAPWGTWCPSPFPQGSSLPAHSLRHYIKFPSTISPCLRPALAQLYLCLAMDPVDLTRGKVKLTSMMIPVCPQPDLVTTSLSNHELYLTLAPQTVSDPYSCSQLDLTSSLQQTWPRDCPKLSPDCHAFSLWLVGWDFTGQTLSRQLTRGAPQIPRETLSLTVLWHCDSFPERRARIFSEIGHAMTTGRRSKFHLENLQLALRTTFSTRRMVSAKAGYIEVKEFPSLKIFNTWDKTQSDKASLQV